MFKILLLLLFCFQSQAATCNDILNESTNYFKVIIPSIAMEQIYDSELDAGAKYADFIFKKKETLVLIPSYEGYSVPGFDGIVTKENKPTYNVSFKTVKKHNLIAAINLSVDRIKNATFNERAWDHTANRLISKRWNEEVKELFGLKDEHFRKTRIVIDITPFAFTYGHYEKIHNIIVKNKNIVDNITILSKNYITEINE